MAESHGEKTNRSPAAGFRHAWRSGRARTAANRRPCPRQCAGQSRHFAAGSRRGFPALLPTQPQALPAHRDFRARRSARAGAGRGSRHPHRPAALPRLEKRRTGRRAGRRAGILARRPRQLRDRLLVFVRGSLAAEGIELRHITRGCNVPMYRTSIATNRAGPFHGPMVVSMRPMSPRDAIRAVQITTRFPVSARRARTHRQAVH